MHTHTHTHTQVSHACLHHHPVPWEVSLTAGLSTAGMPHSPLLTALEDPDLAHQVLQRLTPQALARLGTTCCSLHAVVGQQPEAVWQSAVQQMGFSAAQSLRAASSVQGFLRQQHRLGEAVAAQRCKHVHRATPLEALPSPDGSKLAWVEGEDIFTDTTFEYFLYLRVSCVRTGELLERWSLRPSHKPGQDFRNPPHRSWDPSSRTVVLCMGDPWDVSLLRAPDAAAPRSCWCAVPEGRDHDAGANTPKWRRDSERGV